MALTGCLVDRQLQCDFGRSFEMFIGRRFQDKSCEENVEPLSISHWSNEVGGKALDFCSGHTGSNLGGYTVF